MPGHTEVRVRRLAVIMALVTITIVIARSRNRIEVWHTVADQPG